MDEAQERTLKSPVVQSLEIFLQRRQQDGAHDEGDEYGKQELPNFMHPFDIFKDGILLSLGLCFYIHLSSKNKAIGLFLLS